MRGAVAFAGGALCGALLGSATPALASFGQGAVATAAFTADVLLPPSGLTATAACGVLGVQADLTWQASPSTWLDGYEVAASTVSGGPYTVVPIEAGQDPLATSRAVALEPNTVYYLVARATKGGWTASSAEASLRTRPRCKA